MAWLTDFWVLWVIVGVAAILEAIALAQGRRGRRPTIVVATISSRMWLAIARYKHFTPLFASFWAIVVPHFWLPPTVPRTWTTPEGWAYLVVGLVVIWITYVNHRRGTLMLPQRMKENPVVTGAVAGGGVIALIVSLVVPWLQTQGIDVTENMIYGVIGLVMAGVTWWQRSQVTSVAKLERLEERGAISAHPNVGTMSDAVNTPTKELPPTPPAA
jgi:H+/Cl- antiporter ClcA